MNEVTGEYIAKCYEEDGELVWTARGKNFITDAGLNHIASELSGGNSPMTHLGVGTGTGQTRTSTALATQSGSRAALDNGTPSAVNNVITYHATIPAGTAATLTEGAVFNSSTGGVMLNYFLFSPPRDKTNTQAVTVELEVRIGSLST